MSTLPLILVTNYTVLQVQINSIFSDKKGMTAIQEKN